ncbi:MAG: ATP-binding protein [Thiohalomonadaceae bacterium]
MLSLFKLTGPIGFHEILNSLAEGFTVYDAEGGVVFVNNAAIAQMGVASEEEFLAMQDPGVSRMRLYDLEGRLLAPEQWPHRRALRGEEFVDLEMHIVDMHAGHDWYGSFSGTHVMKDGVLHRAVVVTRDVTELKKAERELARRTRELSNLVGDLESFSYSLAHDLRGPLRAVISYAEILQDDYPDLFKDEPRRLLDRIRLGGLRMAGILDAVLNLSVIARKRPRTTLFDISALASECATELFERHGIAGNFHCASDLWVHGDPDLLRIALTNLLKNAIDYRSPERELVISFGEAERNGQRTFQVADNGIGFDMAEARSRLFKPFSRLGDAPHVEGCGVGLAIVKRIIEHHEGTIGAESARGEGTRFFFTLGNPLQAATAA